MIVSQRHLLLILRTLAICVLILFIPATTTTTTTTTTPTTCPDLLSARHANFVGEIQQRGTTKNGVKMMMETLSVQPPIWRVRSFLSLEESEVYVQAIEEGEKNGKSEASITTAFHGLPGMTPVFEEALHLAYNLHDDAHDLTGLQLTSVDQLQLVLQSLTDASKLDKTRAGACFNVFDANTDGLVDADEWRQQWQYLHPLFEKYKKEVPEIFIRWVF